MCWFITGVVVGLLSLTGGVSAHIVSIDNVLELTIDRDHATGELMVPIEAMLMWSAAQAGRATPDKADDLLAFVKAKGEAVVKGLELTYGDVDMDVKITSTSTRTVDLGFSEEAAPQPMAVYKLEFTPQRKIVAPPAEVSFGHSLLAVPEEFRLTDITSMCFVHFHQAGITGVKNEAVTPEEHVTFKCKWPARPASAPGKSSMTPAIVSGPIVAQVMPASEPSNAILYMLLGSIAVSIAAGVGLGAIFIKRRA